MTTTRSTPAVLSAFVLVAGLALGACGNGDDTTTGIGGESGVVTSGPQSGDGASADVQSPDAGATDSGTSPAGGGAAAVPEPFRDDDAELDVEDQSGDGASVEIEEVQLSRSDGWVAIYTADGERVLGHVAVERSGSESRTSVPLDERLTGTQRLLAVLHADDGDGVFDASTDPWVTDDDDDDDDDDLKTDTFTYRVR